MSESIRSVDRALEVLRCFRDDGGPFGSAEIARRLDLPTSTAHRLIRALAESGFLEPLGRGYRLGPSVVELGLLSYRQRSLQLVEPELDHLQRTTGATADLAIRSGDSVLLVAGGSLRKDLGIGLRRPLHSTALGKVLLAWGSLDLADLPPLRPLTDRTITDPAQLVSEIERVRRAGYALNDGESAVGIRTVAVPISDRSRTARFALALRGTPSAIPDARIPWMLTRARACAKALQVLLLPPESRPLEPVWCVAGMVSPSSCLTVSHVRDPQSNGSEPGRLRQALGRNLHR
jgi:DNA-binding IclR family transcriptional regulator